MQWCFHSGAMIAPTIMYCVECQITAESIFPIPSTTWIINTPTMHKINTNLNDTVIIFFQHNAMLTRVASAASNVGLSNLLTNI